MKSIILFFQVHQSFQLKKYRFLDIGNDPYYYDDFENERKIKFAAENFYLPANELLTGLLQKYKERFKIAFSISGTAIDQFCLYAPDVLESFQRMAYTGGVEFLGETYSYSLASIFDKNEFIRQSLSHTEKIRDLFNQTPSVYKNTELIYSDYIGEIVALMGFKSVVTEGSRHVLLWRSPNYLYQHPQDLDLKLFMNNAGASEDLSFRFNSDRVGAGISNSFISEITNIPQKEQLVNLILNYEPGNERHFKRAGILNFLKSLSSILEVTDFKFLNPSEISNHYSPVSQISIPDIVSRADSERARFSGWFGNELQEEALRKLYSVGDKIENCQNADLLRDWQFLQSLDHLFYMSSRFFSNHQDSYMLNPYNNPYEAFMNYMNILDDFVIRLDHTAKAASRRYAYAYVKSKEPVND